MVFDTSQGLQSLTLHVVRHGSWKKQKACEDDGERCQHRAVTTQTAKECGSLSVRLFLITWHSTDARKLNLPWAHTGLWVDFDFNSVTANQDLCVHLKATSVGVQRKVSELFWFRFFDAGNCSFVASTHMLQWGTVPPPFKASRLELCPGTSGLNNLCLLTWLSNSHTHTHREGEKNTQQSHQGHVPHFSQKERSKKHSVKVRANIWESQTEYNKAFQAVGVMHFISLKCKLNKNDRWISC